MLLKEIMYKEGKLFDLDKDASGWQILDGLLLQTVRQSFQQRGHISVAAPEQGESRRVRLHETPGSQGRWRRVDQCQGDADDRGILYRQHELF